MWLWSAMLCVRVCCAPAGLRVVLMQCCFAHLAPCRPSSPAPASRQTLLSMRAELVACDCPAFPAFLQTIQPTPGQPTKDPVLIPVRMGLLGPDGAELPLKLRG